MSLSSETSSSGPILVKTTDNPVHHSGSLQGRKLVAALIGISCLGLVSLSLVTFGGAGAILNSYVHTSLQQLGQMGSAIGTIGNLVNGSAMLWGMAVVGVLGVAGVIYGSVKIHYAIKAQLPKELQEKFTAFNDSPLGKRRLSEAECQVIRELKKGDFESWQDVDGANPNVFYVIFRTNAFNGKVKVSAYMSAGEKDLLIHRLVLAGFKQNN